MNVSRHVLNSRGTQGEASSRCLRWSGRIDATVVAGGRVCPGHDRTAVPKISSLGDVERQAAECRILVVRDCYGE